MDTRTVFSAVALTAICGVAQAQALAKPSPVGQMVTVEQFGAPRDAAFVICVGKQCPPRSIKHLNAAATQLPERGARAIDDRLPGTAAQPGQGAEPPHDALSHAKAAPP